MDPMNKTTLDALLKKFENNEYSFIDFKADLSLDNVKEKAEIAKDVSAMINLQEGGNLLYGFDNDGNPVGLILQNYNEEDIGRIISNRTMHIPPGIDVKFIDYPRDEKNFLILWIRIPESPYSYPAMFLDKNGLWKAPIKTGSTTNYLNPSEAIAFSQSKDKHMGISPSDMTIKVTKDFQPDKINETLDSNLLPILNMPSHVWSAPAKYDNAYEIADVEGKKLPTFYLWNKRLYSFYDEDTCYNCFTPKSCDIDDSHTEPFMPLVKNEESHSFAMGLLNKTVRSYVISKGLRYDGEKHRLFLRPHYSKERKIKWFAFRKKSTRTVVGLKKRTDGTIDHWYHMGMYLKTVLIKDKFALKITPCWAFTYDGEEIIRSIRMTSLSARRNVLEDNARLLYNFNFWLYFLGDGVRNTIEIPLGRNSIVIGLKPLKITLDVGIKDDTIDPRDRSKIPEDEIPDIEILQELDELDIEQIDVELESDVDDGG